MRRFSTTSGAAATRNLREHLQSVARDLNRVEGSTRVEVVARRWFNYYKEHGGSTRQTVLHYNDIMDRLLVPTFGGLRLIELDGKRITDGLDSLALDGNSRARATRVVLKHVCAYGVREGALATNPVTHDIPTYSGKRAAPKTITSADYGQIRRAVMRWGQARHPGPSRNWNVVLDVLDFMVATGCRTGEALAVRWEDIDVENSTVTICGTIITPRGKGAKVFRQPFTKTTSGFRTIHVGPSTMGMLMRRADETVPGDQSLVFPNDHGGVFAPTGFRYKLRQALREAKLEGFTPVLLRKTGAKEIRDQVSLEAASQVLGHSDVQVTRDHYAGAVHDAPDVAHVMEKFLRQATK